MVKFHKPKFLKEDNLRLDFNIFAEELADAKYALGQIQGSQRKLQNPALLIAPLTAKEATVSSKIEGTQSTVSDVFVYEAGGQPKHSDTIQVSNYRKAMNFALLQIGGGRNISDHLIRSMHEILLSGVRHKGPLGKYRIRPVWIAEYEGDPIEKAIYVPPEAHFVQDYMDDLIIYLNDEKILSLLKAGIAHYQFETVHPFEDGNGRLGRLLIPLIIYHERKLASPILYLSGYFEIHRNEYMKALHDVDQTGKYEYWLKFFLYSVSEQLKDTQKLIDEIYHLYDRTKTEFKSTKSPYLVPFIDFLFESPVFTLPQMQKALGTKSYLTTSNLVKQFKAKNFVQELPIRRGHAKLYRFKSLIDLL